MRTGASKTAVLVAGYRGRASAAPARICDDRWAAALAGEDGRALTARFDAAFASAELWIALRTSFLDDQVRAALDRGASQVVILGAGLDTRAARLARPGARFFEVDHPDTQADKMRRLSALDGYPVAAAAYVACDFEREDFLDLLVAGGFRADEPALVVWEGVTYYLSEAAVRGTLRRVASAFDPRSVIAFDLVRKRLVAKDVKDPGDVATVEIVADLGEPLRFGIDDVVPLLFEEGYRYVRAVSFDEICLEKTGTYERSRAFRFQHVALASRGALVIA